ncbi:MAG: Cna B-type domain-containing protein [Erysipelotrichaceae bacterium]|nr:Cna B-type domain-containing protein [Erysipelotrichaceae bacterium]MBQ5804403.1 Cna B-type domain-containing protein [Erysipelotrichaceae bacterium]
MILGAFENVPVFEDEKEIDYTVKEIETDVLNGNNAEGSYSVAITGNMNDGFIITNIHKTETTPGYEIPKTGIE